MLKKYLSLFVFTLFLVIGSNSVYANCPSIKTAIDEISQLTTLTSPVPNGEGFLYTGSVALNSAKINYYTQNQPTQITPLRQIKLLAPALRTAISQAMPDGSTSCVYLGAMLDPSTADLTGAWHQVIQILMPSSNPKNKMVAIGKCSTTSPFYCTKLYGNALQEPITVEFDTGSAPLSVPIACVNMNNVKVIDDNIIDTWRQPSKLVEGQIALQAQDGTQYLINDYRFYAEEPAANSASANSAPVSCNNSTARIEQGTLGAAPHVIINSGASGTHCLYSFFNRYDYSATQLAPGFTLLPENPPTLGDNMLLQLGADSDVANMFKVNLVRQYEPAGGCDMPPSSLIPAFTDAYGMNFPFTIPNATISFSSTTLAPVSLSNIFSMADSGGGLLTVDDQNGALETTLAAFLDPTQPPQSFPWLQGCKLINPGNMVSYLAKDDNGNTLSYQYAIQDINTQQEYASALCPQVHRDTHSKLLGYETLLHGANVGYGFFSHMSKITLNIDTINNGGFIAVSQ